MMAEAMGATIGKVPDGPVVGSLEIEITASGNDHPLFAGRDDPPVYHFANYEHVATAPAEARVLARRPAMPHVALDYGGGWWSVQFHPEATERSLIAAWSKARPDYAVRYRPLPRCGRVVRSFVLTHAGPVGADDRPDGG
jgi:GMP synthase-like glutamine amidotransferase